MNNALTHYEAALLAEFVGTHIGLLTAFCAKQDGINNPITMADSIVNKLADIADEGNK